MEMLVSSLQEVNLDCSRALKENFIFNKLDGSEDHLVTDSLFALVGKEIQMLRSQLMQSTPPRLKVTGMILAHRLSYHLSNFEF